MSDWIKCSDELPESETPVFVSTGENITTAIREYDSDGWWWSTQCLAGWINDPNSYEHRDDYVFEYWRPMIEPPTPLTDRRYMSTLTLEMIEEAKKLIEALAPRKSPKDIYMAKFPTGLKVMKAEAAPPDTIFLSSELFDAIYEAATSKKR